ncbi:hypothetical protein Slin15195_G089860 [Septoria linicola]|uniref:Uncharacterized protein n=1 Tax=Septoria linicola TaxID=215465 RepID=A0A9Q9EML8_9PEZI|nr:hypothetical protein Slin15195_G089860 [Septoria linicola]
MVGHSWHYPDEISNDLKGVDLPAGVKAEVLACAWEYSRCVISHYTNWKRYVAFMRIIIIGTIAEFRGSLFDMTEDDDNMLGFSLNQVLYDLFEDTAGAKDMAWEYKTFLTVTTDKTSERQHDQFFRAYIKAVSSSPQNWYRLRDCDALCRFTIAAALVCNDIDDVWFSDEQWNVLTEVGDTLYDAIAFYKHRAEGETNNTFAYMPEEIRIDTFRNAREVLWALDVAYAQKPEWQVIVNMIRFFGGPIHMMMRRYRFVEEGLVVGKSEDESVRKAAKKHEKLWHRLELDNSRQQQGQAHFDKILAKEDKLLFRGFVNILDEANRRDSPLSSPSQDSGNVLEEKRFGGQLLSNTDSPSFDALQDANCPPGWSASGQNGGSSLIYCCPGGSHFNHGEQGCKIGSTTVLVDNPSYTAIVSSLYAAEQDSSPATAKATATEASTTAEETTEASTSASTTMDTTTMDSGSGASGNGASMTASSTSSQAGAPAVITAAPLLGAAALALFAL